MRMQTNTFPVYTYEELSDEAKSKVQSWLSEGLDYDFVLEDAATIADLFGLDIRQTRKTRMNGGHRYDPTIYWSGFYSQGDGASFVGTYQYKKGALKAVKAYCGDAEVHRIVKGLQDVQRRHFYKLTARMGRGHNSNFYSHSNTMSVDVSHYDGEYRDIGDAEEEVTQLMRDFADWIYSWLEAEYEYQSSDQAVAEACESNGYEFYEDGSVA